MVKYPASQPVLKQPQPLSGKKRKRGRWW
jgi:hypothetical protein